MANIGTVIAGKYKIEKLIGKGGMSKVYLALDTRLGKHWAVKEIEKNIRDAQKNRVVTNSAMAEVNLIKGLDNYYLPRISDILDNGQTIYVVMDYVEGESLKDLLAREGAQSQDNVIKWGKQLCQVLHYLHTRKPPIIYRDMKPGNVMIKPDGDIKLIDFGIAREYTQRGASDEVSLGTRGYAAPEQFDTALQSDMRTDIYNLGATLYHAVTGRDPSKPPYEIRPIRSCNRGLSQELERIIAKCTNADPKRRYQSAAQLLEALQRIGGDDITLPVADTDDGETTILSEYIPPSVPTARPVSATLTGPSAPPKPVGPHAPVAQGASAADKHMVRGAALGHSQAGAFAKGPGAPSAPSEGRVKPLFIVLPVCAVALIAVIVLLMGAGPEPKDVRELAGEPQGISSIELRWEPSDKADGYEVMVSPDNPAAYENTGKTPPPPIMDVEDSTLVIGDLLCDESYSCEVRAYADDENKRVYQKGRSAAIDIKTAEPDLSVSGVTASAVSYNAASIVWDPVTITGCAVSYHLLAGTSADGEYAEQYAGAEPAFSVGSLVPQTDYYFKVVADTIADGKAFSKESDTVNIATAAIPVAVPTIKADAEGYSSISVKWDKIEVAGAEIKYVLERSTQKDDGFAQVHEGGEISNTDTGLDASTRYYYRVTVVATVSGKESRATSEVASAKTSARPAQTYTPSQPRTQPRPKPTPSSPDPVIGT
ncbi:MAG: protein kinase [Clostridiales Family XIII bacterium]|jgi:tRNA A-37 threonylcarbamoyl transferase component Bud32|nr:protein kinase [Clostridiales Family XIII bacterium]